jgi:hypothetical protein
MEKLFSKTTFVVLVTALLLPAATATAQSDDDGEGTRSQFIEFEEQWFQGGTKSPDGEMVRGRDSTSFERLHRIDKKSFLPRVQKSSHEDALQ